MNNGGGDGSGLWRNRRAIKWRRPKNGEKWSTAAAPQPAGNDHECWRLAPGRSKKAVRWSQPKAGDRFAEHPLQDRNQQRAECPEPGAGCPVQGAECPEPGAECPAQEQGEECPEQGGECLV